MSALTEQGVIEALSYGDQDHGILSFHLHIKFDGSSQGFGGIALNDVLAHSLANELAYAFSVSAAGPPKEVLQRLVGKSCVAYRCFLNDRIEAIKPLGPGEYGLFVVTEWLQKNGFKAKDPLEMRKEEIQRHIERMRRDLPAAEVELAEIARRYTPVRGRKI